ncbi:toll/interleukin-1 receptor domain-containing protein [Curtobacterium flaccumfaciens]|uniref:toll/interleukin-1 receptor domain-containing protein n=1 Tax=Curtobacterium flaccumfaciens TaxID=2035 RepID=UPI000FFEEE24|nr:toll/interleukin-1 receptor domain-containing protein [Curtobacterium flaccumfaciens]MCS0647181.1 toll/interleukin-1 receptor domain-containing protein [Curtobacterium flaccumfaciens pv. flaccumfaciens]MCS6524776.1 toll/interleukin-1 receptor domain-containing protein [Curtobacterium flaccumfaciens pv. flaccumfaciens]MCS6529921.1 toll/interleukin-1 receptor domain-containing protein [Curtobacterium flaccumfaciens pv. flaccumfaciens]NUU09865.1 toll/interleukin-1 receptor domain-containing pro
MKFWSERSSARRWLLLIALALFSALVVLVVLTAVFRLGPDGATSEYIPALVSVFAAVTGVVIGILRESVSDRKLRKQVFIAYAHEDRQVAESIAATVRSAGYSPWLDVEQVLPGENIEASLERAIRSSGAAIFIVPSGPLAQSSYLQRELFEITQRIRPLGRDVQPILPIVQSEGQVKNLPANLSGISALSVGDAAWESRLTDALRRAFA